MLMITSYCTKALLFAACVTSEYPFIHSFVVLRSSGCSTSRPVMMMMMMMIHAALCATTKQYTSRPLFYLSERNRNERTINPSKETNPSIKRNQRIDR
mmetsp:Transcript_46234/g.68871  ORF Transcript_46234/g.68871 Transcript_46234/m.68871 type:complete len:98 (+) Transcript_46234:49-342(+)